MRRCSACCWSNVVGICAFPSNARSAPARVSPAPQNLPGRTLLRFRERLGLGITHTHCLGCTVELLLRFLHLGDRVLNAGREPGFFFGQTEGPITIDQAAL